MAKRRAAFKKHLTSYLIVNTGLVLVWAITILPIIDDMSPNRRIYSFWPIWPILGWGIGLVSHYFGVYVYDEQDSIEREYRKLQR
jgi:sterol desaturase/sphingolipid hydroxylase (fatty acid hydroxylase superfamily)